MLPMDREENMALLSYWGVIRLSGPSIPLECMLAWLQVSTSFSPMQVTYLLEMIFSLLGEQP